MERNLDRRVEAIVPVEDPEARGAARRDHRRDARRRPPLVAARPGRDLGPDRGRSTGGAGTVDTFEDAEGAGPRAAGRGTPHRPRAGVGSLDPRAMTSASARGPDRADERDRPPRPPVEIELKYRVVDLAAARALPGGRRPRPGSRRRRAVAVDPGRGSLHRHGRRRAGPGRLRGPAPADRARRRPSSVKSAVRREGAERRRPSPRGARGPGRPDRAGRATGRPPTPGRWSSSCAATRRSSRS